MKDHVISQSMNQMNFIMSKPMIIKHFLKNLFMIILLD